MAFFQNRKDKKQRKIDEKIFNQGYFAGFDKSLYKIGYETGVEEGKKCAEFLAEQRQGENNKG